MKGVPFSMEGIRKGYLFCKNKKVYERGRAWSSGRRLPEQNFVGCPPGNSRYPGNTR